MATQLSTYDKIRQSDLTTSNILFVANMLHVIRKKWKTLGEELGVNIEGIESNYKSTELRLLQTLWRWMQWYDPSWRKLTDALLRMKEDDLATLSKGKYSYSSKW